MKLTNEKKNERRHFFYDREICASCGQKGNHFIAPNKTYPTGKFTCEPVFTLEQIIHGSN